MLQTLERYILDPMSEDPSNQPFQLTGRDAGHGVYLGKVAFPEPDVVRKRAFGRETEGEMAFGFPRHENRRIPFEVLVSESMGVGEIDGLTVNLIGNPSLETDLTGWAVSSGNTTRLTTDGYTGESCLQILGATYEWAGYPITLPLGIHTIVFYRKTINHVSTSGLGAGVALEGGTGVSSVVGQPKENQIGTSLGTTGWTRGWFTVNVTTAGTFTIRAANNYGGAGSGTVRFDSFLCVAGAVTEYFDGDTPGCAWFGAPQLSSSARVGTGSDRKRFERSLNDLEQKIMKISREEKGQLKRYLPDGTAIIFDLVGANFTGDNWDRPFNQGQQVVEFELEAKPYARLAPVTLGVEKTETTKPVLTWAEDSIPGSVPALVDLAIRDAEGGGKARKWLCVGQRHRNYDAAATAALFYEAEALTALGGSAVATRTGASPTSAGSNNVLRNTALSPIERVIMSTGALTHVGAYRVMARVYRATAGNEGNQAFYLEWSQGDYRKRTSNDPVELAFGDRMDAFVWIDLGIVRIPRTPVGSHRWEGRLVASSTQNADDVDVDCLALMPIEDGYGEGHSIDVAEVPSTFLAYDDFNTHALFAELTTLTAPTGGNWDPPSAGTWDAQGFFIGLGAEELAYRSETGDLSTAPQMNLLSGVNAASIDVGGQVNVEQGFAVLAGTLYFRAMCVCRAALTGANYLRFGIGTPITGTPSRQGVLRGQYLLELVTGSTVTVLGASSEIFHLSAAARMKVRLRVDVDGNWTFWGGPRDGELKLVGQGQRNELKTGGTHATGSVGIFDTWRGTSALTRWYDDFSAFTPTLDAAIFASRRARVRHDRALREDPSGAYLNEITEWTGDRFRAPPSLREKRKTEYAVMALAGDPRSGGADPGIYDLGGLLTVTPRVLNVPEVS